jgi:hypothetical protein
MCIECWKNTHIFFFAMPRIKKITKLPKSKLANSSSYKQFIYEATGT